MAPVSLRQRLDDAVEHRCGVPVEEIRRGIDSGVRKALAAAKNAARDIVKARFEAFGCAGQAARIKPVPLEAMIQRYR